MRIQSAVLFIFLLLTAVVGWLVAQVSSPKFLILLIGIAIGMIIGAPISLIVANALGSQTARSIRRPQIRQRQQVMQPPVTPNYPQVIVVPPMTQQSYQQWPPTYEEIELYDEQPPARPIRFLGEE